MSKHRASTAVTALDSFDSRTAGEHDPGQIIILFDHRHILPRPEDNKMSSYQAYYLDGLSRMGWATYWEKPNLDPGKIQLLWYTHAGAQGTRNYPLHKCHLVKEMFDSLSTEGFRPLILGWSAENPYPMIGGIEPPPPPKAPKMKVVTSTSGTVSGHGGKDGSTPHDRVMAIIVKEEEREAKARAEIVEKEKKAEALGYGV
ncbi:hypothetical protein LTR91_011246 [Friedmanniomyces endolithicus]|uniref:Uncharacterized protein n=1 Tax=Friedmanniomyces endolithicus TaxID=329885 RepID=A0A4U0VHB9_9PEZI|nr:hypothetical protein LTS09_005048 [Friedmanniomyces endolithicus]KAK0290398.1 hypothetical protein LTR35_002341 [Friedmanniomyces endolithicus]KAK0295897.1 hypothetical protein LTS00_005638 [Friedmanniomyces endolithicus]KAK0305567.1 hypothetical protein LTR01_006714 [Friedmanniomyces endolithicus]KAK0325869.1 hypothetical protein LTR82_003408 [Friedmanniomyces endolithicus]